MPETIETFVSRLHEEGVEAGKREAEEIISAAKKQADVLLQDASASAREMIEQAERQRATIRSHAETQLRLAARDAVLKLTDALSAAIRAGVEQDATAVLADPAWLASVLKEVIVSYAGDDAAGKSDIQIRLRDNVLSDVRKQLPAYLSEEGNGQRAPSPTLTSSLEEMGFSYTIRGYIIQVTPQSVAALLAEMVTDDLAAVVQDAVARSRDENGEAFALFEEVSDDSG